MQLILENKFCEVLGWRCFSAKRASSVCVLVVCGEF